MVFLREEEIAEVFNLCIQALEQTLQLRKNFPLIVVGKSPVMRPEDVTQFVEELKTELHGLSGGLN